jgi:hypothetical protein
MPFIRRRPRLTSRSTLTPDQKYELLTGRACYSLPAYYTGFGDARGDDTDMRNFVTDEMERCWEAHRDDLINFWKSGKCTTERPWLFCLCTADSWPWGARMFDNKPGGNAPMDPIFGT